MKELSIEEKAKRYDDAIKIAKDSFNYPDYPGFIRADVVFPELKESEDERIRKDLITYIKSIKGNTFDLTMRSKDWLAWLEKQGEKKPFDYENANIQPKDFAFIESKFKVGDWVVYENRVGLIIRMLKGHYIISFDGVEEQVSFTFNDRITKWTIQDAKDGDVLASDDGSICVFDGTVEDGKYPFAYCGLTRYGFESYDKKLPFTHDNVCPATKEQRNLLSEKMKQEGYEWDGDNLYLKNIEQNPIEWSEEDEYIVQALVNCLDELKENCGWNYAYTNSGKNIPVDALKSWLEKQGEKEAVNKDAEK